MARTFRDHRRIPVFESQIGATVECGRTETTRICGLFADRVDTDGDFAVRGDASLRIHAENHRHSESGLDQHAGHSRCDG